MITSSGALRTQQRIYIINLLNPLLKGRYAMASTEVIEERLIEIMDHLKPRNFSLTISLPHLAILRWLSNKGRISISVAARWADVSQPAMTQAAQSLEKKGLVRRTRDLQDQRIVWLSLTEVGQAQVEAFKGLQRERLHFLLTSLNEKDQDHLLRILTAMITTIPSDEERV